METASGTISDLIHLRKLIEEGEIRTVIDRTYQLEQIIEDQWNVETGPKWEM